jgi:hypothetical protein
MWPKIRGVYKRNQQLPLRRDPMLYERRVGVLRKMRRHHLLHLEDQACHRVDLCLRHSPQYRKRMKNGMYPHLRPQVDLPEVRRRMCRQYPRSDSLLLNDRQYRSTDSHRYRPRRRVLGTKGSRPKVTLVTVSLKNQRC